MEICLIVYSFVCDAGTFEIYVSGQISLTEDIGEPYKVRIGFMGGTSGVQKYLPQSVSSPATTLHMIIVTVESWCGHVCEYAALAVCYHHPDAW